jgi:hypothetical protein
MKKTATLLIISFLTFFISCAQDSFDAKILSFANDTNRNLPAMVDSTTRLENVSVHSGKIYQYNYTLITVEKKNFNIEVFTKNQKPILINGVRQFRNKAGFNFFADNHVNFAYSYKDKNGEYLLKILVTPNDYN